MTTSLRDHLRACHVFTAALAILAVLGGHPAVAQPLQGTSINDELLRLVHARVDDSIIIDVIEKARGRYDSSVDAILRLKAQGASDRVIAALRGLGSTLTGRSSAAVSRAGGGDAGLVIPDGTEVRLRLVERVSSASARVGESVRLEVAQDVTVDNRVVIAAGAPAIGTVTVAESRKSFGRRGKLDFTIDSVKTVDDQPVRLRITRRAEGDSRYLATGVVTYFTGLGGFFVKGKDVEVDAGTQYVIYIDGDRRVGATALAATR